MNAAARAAELLIMHPVRALASLLPVISAILFAVIANLPVSLTGGLVPAPLLALAAVYFWVLVRPDLMPPAAALVLGLLDDLLSGGPPGLWAAGFLAAYALADRQRENLAGLAGVGAVIGFAGAMLVAAFAVYGLASIVFLRFPPAAPLLLESAVTVIFYPLVALSMGWVHRHVLGSMRGQD